ncbi:hypothetical protein [Myroides sp. DW712]|uniref:hypothetical protein n=1 Tax=Myroides sp. DW712 TaxID=3389800 RepID=UPI003977EF62
MYKVTVKGFGQLNGPVIINKTVEMDNRIALSFVGAKRYDVITDFVKVHYPGVKFDPKNFSVNIVEIIEKKKKESNKKANTVQRSKTVHPKKERKDFSILNSVKKSVSNFIEEEFSSNNSDTSAYLKQHYNEYQTRFLNDIEQMVFERDIEYSKEFTNKIISNLKKLNTLECDEHTDHLFKVLKIKLEEQIKSINTTTSEAELKSFKKDFFFIKIKRFLKKTFNS